MTDANTMWCLAYLIKIYRGEITLDAKQVADKAKADFEEMMEDE